MDTAEGRIRSPPAHLTATMHRRKRRGHSEFLAFRHGLDQPEILEKSPAVPVASRMAFNRARRLARTAGSSSLMSTASKKVSTGPRSWERVHGGGDDRSCQGSRQRYRRSSPYYPRLPRRLTSFYPMTADAGRKAGVLRFSKVSRPALQFEKARKRQSPRSAEALP